MTVSTEKVLAVEGLEIRYRGREQDVVATADVSFALRQGQCFGLVGESGCGKSSIAMAVMRHLGERGRIANGRVLFCGRDMATLSDVDLRRIRGKRIAMVYQSASMTLNPTMTIGAQLSEVLRDNPHSGNRSVRDRVTAMLTAVEIADPEGMLRRFPHQISGGQQQRIIIAMAFLAEPDLLILDEPTTSLDVTIEAQIMNLLAGMRAAYGTTMLFISHNIGLVRLMCDAIGVMYAGQIVEQGPAEAILAEPRHPYTRRLLQCIPRLDLGRADYRLRSIPGQVPRLHAIPDHCIFLERCERARGGVCDRPIATESAGDGRRIKCRRWTEFLPEKMAGASHIGVRQPSTTKGATVLEIDRLSKSYEVRRLLNFARRPIASVRANDSICLELHAGETLGIVGESGCGKSTLARIIMGLEMPTSGRIALLGQDVTEQGIARRSTAQIRNVQMVFQNPDSTLNPSHTVGFILERAVKKLRSTRNRTERLAEVGRLLDLVRLPRELMQVPASRLSGGQKQRVAVARAFAGRPSLVVADEPTSALDTSVKTAILELLLSAQKELGTALIFISHDLAVVRYVADRVAVMYGGRIVEIGDAPEVFSPPYHPYCELLMSSVPGPESSAPGRARQSGEVYSAGTGGLGCTFAPRCSRAVQGLCELADPPFREGANGHLIRCHLPIASLN